jgi:hypothetical protein
MIGLLNNGELWQDPAEKAKAMESENGHEALKEAVEEFFAHLPSSFLQTVVLSSMDSWFHLFRPIQQQPADCPVDVEDASGSLIDLSRALLLRFHTSKERSYLDALMAYFLDASEFFPVGVGLPGMTSRRITLYTHFLLLNETRHPAFSKEHDMGYITYYQSPNDRSKLNVHPIEIMLKASAAQLGRYKETKERYELDVAVRLLRYLVEHPRLDEASRLWDSVQGQVTQLAEAYYGTLPDLKPFTDDEKHELFHSKNLEYELLFQSCFVALLGQYQSAIGDEDRVDSGRATLLLDKVIRRLSLLSPDHLALHTMVNHLAATFVENYLSNSGQITIQFALQTLKRVVPAFPPEYPWLSLAGAFQTHYDRDQKLSHLNTSKRLSVRLSTCICM